MGKIKTKNLLLSYLVTLLLFASDRILKYLALNKKLTFLGEFFELHKNTGIAFSIPLPTTIVLVLVIVILIILVSASLKYLKKQKLSLHFSILFIIAGAVSNLIDRFKFDFVIDYINLKFWPVFNLADVMIVAGVILWLWSLRKTDKDSLKSKV